MPLLRKRSSNVKYNEKEIDKEIAKAAIKWHLKGSASKKDDDQQPENVSEAEKAKERPTFPQARKPLPSCQQPAPAKKSVNLSLAINTRNVPEVVYSSDGRKFFPCHFCCRAFAFKKRQVVHMENCIFRKEKTELAKAKGDSAAVTKPNLNDIEIEEDEEEGEEDEAKSLSLEKPSDPLGEGLVINKKKYRLRSKSDTLLEVPKLLKSDDVNRNLIYDNLSTEKVSPTILRHTFVQNEVTDDIDESGQKRIPKITIKSIFINPNEDNKELLPQSFNRNRVFTQMPEDEAEDTDEEQSKEPKERVEPDKEVSDALSNSRIDKSLDTASDVTQNASEVEFVELKHDKVENKEKLMKKMKRLKSRRSVVRQYNKPSEIPAYFFESIQLRHVRKSISQSVKMKGKKVTRGTVFQVKSRKKIKAPATETILDDAQSILSSENEVSYNTLEISENANQKSSFILEEQINSVHISDNNMYEDESTAKNGLEDVGPRNISIQRRSQIREENSFSNTTDTQKQICSKVNNNLADNLTEKIMDSEVIIAVSHVGDLEEELQKKLDLSGKIEEHKKEQMKSILPDSFSKIIKSKLEDLESLALKSDAEKLEGKSIVENVESSANFKYSKDIETVESRLSEIASSCQHKTRETTDSSTLETGSEYRRSAFDHQVDSTSSGLRPKQTLDHEIKELPKSSKNCDAKVSLRENTDLPVFNLRSRTVEQDNFISNAKGKKKARNDSASTQLKLEDSSKKVDKDHPQIPTMNDIKEDQQVILKNGQVENVKGVPNQDLPSCNLRPRKRLEEVSENAPKSEPKLKEVGEQKIVNDQVNILEENNKKLKNKDVTGVPKQTEERDLPSSNLRSRKKFEETSENVTKSDPKSKRTLEQRIDNDRVSISEEKDTKSKSKNATGFSNSIEEKDLTSQVEASENVKNTDPKSKLKLLHGQEIEKEFPSCNLRSKKKDNAVNTVGSIEEKKSEEVPGSGTKFDSKLKQIQDQANNLEEENSKLKNKDTTEKKVMPSSKLRSQKKFEEATENVTKSDSKSEEVHEQQIEKGFPSCNLRSKKKDDSVNIDSSVDQLSKKPKPKTKQKRNEVEDNSENAMKSVLKTKHKIQKQEKNNDLPSSNLRSRRKSSLEQESKILNQSEIKQVVHKKDKKKILDSSSKAKKKRQMIRLEKETELFNHEEGKKDLPSCNPRSRKRDEDVRPKKSNVERVKNSNSDKKQKIHEEESKGDGIDTLVTQKSNLKSSKKSHVKEKKEELSTSRSKKQKEVQQNKDIPSSNLRSKSKEDNVPVSKVMIKKSPSYNLKSKKKHEAKIKVKVPNSNLRPRKVLGGLSSSNLKSKKKSNLGNKEDSTKNPKISKKVFSKFKPLTKAKKNVTGKMKASKSKEDNSNGDCLAETSEGNETSNDENGKTTIPKDSKNSSKSSSKDRSDKRFEKSTKIKPVRKLAQKSPKKILSTKLSTKNKKPLVSKNPRTVTFSEPLEIAPETVKEGNTAKTTKEEQKKNSKACKKKITDSPKKKIGSKILKSKRPKRIAVKTSPQTKGKPLKKLKQTRSQRPKDTSRFSKTKVQGPSTSSNKNSKNKEKEISPLQPQVHTQDTTPEPVRTEKEVPVTSNAKFEESLQPKELENNNKEVIPTFFPLSILQSRKRSKRTQEELDRLFDSLKESSTNDATPSSIAEIRRRLNSILQKEREENYSESNQTKRVLRQRINIKEESSESIKNTTIVQVSETVSENRISVSNVPLSSSTPLEPPQTKTTRRVIERSTKRSKLCLEQQPGNVAEIQQNGGNPNDERRDVSEAQLNDGSEKPEQLGTVINKCEQPDDLTLDANTDTVPKPIQKKSFIDRMLQLDGTTDIIKQEPEARPGDESVYEFTDAEDKALNHSTTDQPNVPGANRKRRIGDSATRRKRKKTDSEEENSELKSKTLKELEADIAEVSATNSTINSSLLTFTTILQYKVCPFPYCSEMFQTEEQFIEHKITKHQIGRIKLGPDKLEKYDRLYQNSDKKKCPICFREITATMNWKRHLKTHSKERDFTCSICKKTFSRIDHMKNHEKRHLDTIKKTYGLEQENSNNSENQDDPGNSVSPENGSSTEGTNLNNSKDVMARNQDSATIEVSNTDREMSEDV